MRDQRASGRVAADAAGKAVLRPPAPPKDGAVAWLPLARAQISKGKSGSTASAASGSSYEIRTNWRGKWPGISKPVLSGTEALQLAGCRIDADSWIEFPPPFRYHDIINYDLIAVPFFDLKVVKAAPYAFLLSYS